MCTAKDNLVSPNFLVWKFCGKEHFPHSFGRNRPKLCGNCSFPQNFDTRKLGETALFLAVNLCLIFLYFLLRGLTGNCVDVFAYVGFFSV